MEEGNGKREVIWNVNKEYKKERKKKKKKKKISSVLITPIRTLWFMILFLILIFLILFFRIPDTCWGYCVISCVLTYLLGRSNEGMEHWSLNIYRNGEALRNRFSSLLLKGSFLYPSHTAYSSGLLVAIGKEQDMILLNCVL